MNLRACRLFVWIAVGPTRPYVKREIVDKALKASKNSNARNAEPERFYDNSFVKTLDDAGFLNSLFGNP